MKGFKIDSDGDIIIEKNKITMTQDADLTRQTIVSVLKTNKGEWFLNTDEGIRFRNLLTKSPTEEMVKNEVQGGIDQVDPDLHITEFEMSTENRNLAVNFKAVDNRGNALEGATIYA